MMNIRGPFSKVSFEPINLNSSDQVKNYLLSIGWKPTEWNYQKGKDGRILKIDGHLVRTSPKITEDSLESIEGDFGILYREYVKYSSRRKLIENFDDPDNKGLLSYVREDGTISAEAITLGTPTARYRHKVVVNIPRPGSFLGEEVRSLFTVPDGCILIGSDLSGIEARLMAHLSIIFDDPEFASILMTNPDIHTWTAEQIGNQIGSSISRNDAKSLRYALSYGAQKAKIATMLGIKPSVSEKIIEAFWNSQAGLKRAKEALEVALRKKGHIRGLDGRKLYLTAKHTLLNYYIQSAAAIIFKKWMILFDNLIEDAGFRFLIKQIIAYHDELQFKACPDVFNWAVQGLSYTCMQSGEHYNIKVPIECETKVGITWADTH